VRTVGKWQQVWARRDSPGHRADSPEFYRACAKELRILFGENSPKRVLEIGCGNGVLFEFLGFEHAQYKGVDFSPRLLASFKAKHPNVELECCEGSSYRDAENKYDLIFSNEVVQFFDLPMLDEHFACARAMMDKASVVVCAAIPWRLHRSHYDSGRLSETLSSSMLSATKAKLARTLRGDSIGRWYEPREITSLAKKHGLFCDFYGSMFYFYRFHVTLRVQMHAHE
jgi:SAM-dependent methyltransferase